MATITAGDFRNGKTFRDGRQDHAGRGIPACQARQGRGLRPHQDEERCDRRRHRDVLQPHCQVRGSLRGAQGYGVQLQRRRPVLLHGSGDLRHDPPGQGPAGRCFPLRHGEHRVQGPQSYKGNVFGLECPNFMDLEVTETEPGLAGNTATNTLKPATVETGAEVKVPLFINDGRQDHHRHPHR